LQFNALLFDKKKKRSPQFLCRRDAVNGRMLNQQKEAKTRLSLVGDGQGWRVFAPAQRVYVCVY
jgi:hypothetical protein